MHSRTDSIQANLDYAVSISHLADSGNSIMYYGDSDGDGRNERNITTGQNICLVSSTGYAADSMRTIEAALNAEPWDPQFQRSSISALVISVECVLGLDL